jgi:nucleoid DNA-binding protein
MATSKRKTTASSTAKAPGARVVTTRIKPAAKEARAPHPVPREAGAAPEGKPALNLVMRKKRLLDLVVARSHVKKKFAKPVAEAVLEVMAEAMAAGEELNLPPLGKVKVQRQIEQARAKVSVVRIRQPHASKPQGKDPLAKAAE